MMKRVILILLGIIAVLLFVSCKSKEDKLDEAMRKILEPFRTGPVFMDEETKVAYDLYHAIRRYDVEGVKNAIEKGADPNYCLGEARWVDSNPLSVDGMYETYYRRLRGEIIPNPTPEVEILNMLVEAGADINRRPYIWDIVISYNNRILNGLWKSFIRNGEPVGVEVDTKESYIKDVNRLIEAYLQAGADPDKLGHPYPFSREAIYDDMMDEKANGYFAQGTRAINEAIEKGMAWESQVDLLLQYTTLDEESLKAAERSNDHAMVEKIQRLWEGEVSTK